MYTVYVDGKLLFSNALNDAERVIISPRLDLDINGAGSFSFVLPPGNAEYHSIHRLKSIITVKLDDEIIFRGRAVDDEKDIYNQKNVYCEGDRSFLLDSIQKPYSYSGGVQAFFRKLVTSHNAQVDAEKQFTVGEITAVSSSATMEAEDDDYTDTASRIEDRLLGVYGGWLRTRTEGEITYLDWLTKDGEPGEQTVEFGVNLLDIKDKLDASQVFTCLIPLGESKVDSEGEYTDPVGISSVNGGKDYIQDDESVALYGKIWRTHTWSNERDPAELLKKAREYMETGIAVQSMTLQFIDMHFTDESRKRVFIGDHPIILSDPNGISLSAICVKASLDLVNPEKSTYTFGEAPMTLTENFIQTKEDTEIMTGGRGGGGGGAKKKLEAKLRWAIIEANEKTAQINLLTHDQAELTGRVSNAEIRLDGIDASILLKADRELVNELETRVTSAEVSIDGMNAKIVLKADAKIVDELGDRVGSAELAIDGMNSKISLKADKIDLEGYVTMEKFNSTVGTSALLSVGQLTANTVTAKTSMYLGSKQLTTTQFDVITSVSLSPSYTSVTNNEGNSKLVLVEGTSISRTKTKINVVTWE